MSERLENSPYTLDNVITLAEGKNILTKIPPDNYFYGSVSKEFPISDGVSFHIKKAESASFIARYSLAMERVPSEWEGKLFAFATSYDEEITRDFYYNADEDEEVSEEEFYDNYEENDNYYEDTEILGTKTNYQLAFSPIVKGEVNEAIFNVTEENTSNQMTLFVPRQPLPFELIRGTDMLRALKASVMNNSVNSDLISLREWSRMSINMSVPIQTRLTIASALDDYIRTHPNAKTFL